MTRLFRSEWTVAAPAQKYVGVTRVVQVNAVQSYEALLNYRTSGDAMIAERNSEGKSRGGWCAKKGTCNL